MNHVELLRRLNDDVINAGDLGVLDELMAADIVHERRGLTATFRRFAPPPGEVPPTARERFARGLATIRAAFPDWRSEVVAQVADGDVVVERLRVTGTHRGPFLGLAPTGRRIELLETVFFTFEGGRIARIWALAAEADLWEQLGLLDPPGGP